MCHLMSKYSHSNAFFYAGPCTVWCCYKAVDFLQNPHIDTPWLARKGEIWGVLCEYKLWFIARLSFCKSECNIMIWFRLRSKKTSKLHVTGLCEWNWPVASEFPTQKAGNAENISIWWHHPMMTTAPNCILYRDKERFLIYCSLISNDIFFIYRTYTFLKIR